MIPIIPPQVPPEDDLTLPETPQPILWLRWMAPSFVFVRLFPTFHPHFMGEHE